MRPTGPIIPRDPVERFTSGVLQMLQNVRDHGADVTVTYTLPDGRVLPFTFLGEAYKGKPIKQIDVAFAWEVTQFAKKEGLA